MRIAATAGEASRARERAAAAPESGSMLSTPTVPPEDAMTRLYRLLVETNRVTDETAVAEATQRSSEKKKALEDRRAALERARKAREEETGFFDSIGVLGLSGLATANPWLVVADVCMHMSRATPEFLRDFERKDMSSVETVAKADVALAALRVACNPQALGAAIALGGVLAQETKLFGSDGSDWAGRAALVATGALGGDGRRAMTAFFADKDDRAATRIRELEADTREYTRFVAIAGMAMAAAGAAVGSMGSATIVAIGLALSAAGMAIAETKCIGDEASVWVGSGMMIGGAVVSGFGAAAASSALSELLAASGTAVSATAQMRGGADSVRGASTAYAADRAHIDAERAQMRARRLERMLEGIVDTVRDADRDVRRMATTVKETIEVQVETAALASAAIKG